MNRRASPTVAFGPRKSQEFVPTLSRKGPKVFGRIGSVPIDAMTVEKLAKFDSNAFKSSPAGRNVFHDGPNLWNKIVPQAGESE
jgi:hypothetical protein